VDINQTDTHNLTPLQYAVFLDYFQFHIVFTLIKNGANVNAIHSDYGCHHCKTESCFQAVISLLPRIKCDRMELLSLFLSHGADPNEQSNNTSGGSVSDYVTRFTPIHSLALQNSVEGVKLLLQAKANVNAMYSYRGSDGWGDTENTLQSPLHIAVENQNLEMVQLLIECKAEINIIRNHIENRPDNVQYVDDDYPVNNIEKTALHIAIQKKSKDIVKYLVLCGANPFIEYIEGSKGIDSWDLCGNDEELKLLLDCIFTIKDYPLLPKDFKITLKVLLLCDLRNNWRLPKDILFKIFSHVKFLG